MSGLRSRWRPLALATALFALGAVAGSAAPPPRAALPASTAGRSSGAPGVRPTASPPLVSATSSVAAASACQASLAKAVAPDTAVGAEVAITLTAVADCARAQSPVHAVLVVDNSLDTGGTKIADLRQAVVAFVDALDLGSGQVGLVSYAVQPEVLSELTADGDSVKEAAKRFFPRRGSNLRAAIRLGADVLARGRTGDAAPGVQEVLLLVVASAADGQPADIVAEAAAARARGFEIVTVAAGGGADIALLQALASASTLAYVEGTSSRLPSLARQIVSDLTAVRLLGAQIDEVLPPELSYSWGSGIPAPRVRQQSLGWAYAVWPTAGITVTYGVVCAAAGAFASHVTSTLTLQTDRAGTLRWSWPAATVRCALPTTPTSTSTPTARPATPAPVTPTATPTPTPAPRAIYLPLAMRTDCLRTGAPLDVALVIDTSSSMLQSSAAGRPKLELAIEAAGTFIDSLGLPVDRAAIVAFQHDAAVIQPLSGELGTLQTQLAAAVGHVGFGSRVDLGLAAGQAALAGGRDGIDRRLALVLLTDGRADDAAAARQSAAAARAAGITIYSIGLGDDLDEPLLVDLAGSPNRYEHSPTGADLVAIYRRLALVTSCGAGRE